MKEKEETNDNPTANEDDGGTAVKEKPEQYHEFFGGEGVDDLEAIAGSGFLGQMLGRTSSQVKRDRAANIAEEVKVALEQKIQATDRRIRQLKRDLKNHFDFSPDNTFSLVMAENVNGREVVEKDTEVFVEAALLTRKNRYYKIRYNYLFGKKFEIKPLEELL